MIAEYNRCNSKGYPADRGVANDARFHMRITWILAFQQA